jgi:hypothetical protein
MATRSREYQIRVSTVLVRGASAIGQDLSAGMARARKDAERDAQKMGEGLKKGVKAGVDGATSEFGRMKSSAKQTYSELEKLALKVGKDQEREAVRVARATSREQVKEANRASAEISRAKREEVRMRAREEAQIVSDTRRQLREQSKYRQDEGRKAARDEERTRRDAERSRRREEAQIISDTRRQLREQSKYKQDEARKAAREEARVARDLEQVYRSQERAKVRDMRRSDRDRDRGEKTKVREVKEFASSAMGTMRTIGGAGMNVGREMLAGAGISFDLSSAVNKAVKLESLAVQISNAGSTVDEKGEVKRKDPKALEEMAREIAQKYAFDPQSVLEGAAAYQAKTGDLNTAIAGIKELAQLAKATSTDLGDMVSAAGDVGTALGEVGVTFKTPEAKAAAIQKIMRTIAAQGAKGAVEIRDLSVQMAKLAAASQAFEGDASENLTFMGTLAQLSRQKGGSASSTQAATSVASFVGMLKTPARMAQYEKHTGEKLYNEESGFLKNPKEIIKKAMISTMANPEELKEIFANMQGERAAAGSVTTFRQGMAEARAKGMTKDKDVAEYGANKVFAEWEKFSETMSQKQIDDNVSKSMDTKESRAQLFQNQLEKVVAAMADKVLPQMEKLGPKVIEVVEALAKLVSWASTNPGQAITMAIVASIGKAAIGSVISKGIESLLSGAVGGGAGALGGGAGLLGKAVPVAAAGAAGFAIGTAITSGIEWAESEATEGGNQAARRDARVFSTMNALHKASAGGSDEDIDTTLRAAERMKAELATDIENAKDPTSYAGAIFSGKTIEEAGKEQADSQHLAELSVMLERLSTSIDGLTKKRLKVDADITSMPMSGVNQSGRSGVSG